MVNFSVTGSPEVTKFLRQYHQWCLSRRWSGIDHPPLADSHHLGIPVINYCYRDAIENSVSPIVGIDVVREGLHQMPILMDLPKDKHYVIFSGGWWDKNKIQMDLDYTLIYWPFFLFDMHDHHTDTEQPYIYLDKNYHWDYPKSCLFANISGVPRDHRVRLLDALKTRLSSDEFIYRLNGIDHGRNLHGIDLFDFSSDMHASVDIMRNKFSFLEQEPSYAHYRTVVAQVFDQAYFQLAVETDFNGYADQFFITEKTLRALMMGQPFVSVATVGFLEHLRSLGFQTYSDLWDESYDLEKRPDSRLEKIAELCYNLRNFDWTYHKEKLKSIGQHNQSRFMFAGQMLEKFFIDFEQQLSRIPQ